MTALGEGLEKGEEGTALATAAVSMATEVFVVAGGAAMATVEVATAVAEVMVAAADARAVAEKEVAPRAAAE